MSNYYIMLNVIKKMVISHFYVFFPVRAFIFIIFCLVYLFVCLLLIYHGFGSGCVANRLPKFNQINY